MASDNINGGLWIGKDLEREGRDRMNVIFRHLQGGTEGKPRRNTEAHYIPGYNAVSTDVSEEHVATIFMAEG
jgi:hypothetical protein